MSDTPLDDATLNELFPDLSNILRQWDRPAAAGDGSDDPTHSGLTLDDFNNLPAPDAPFAHVAPGAPPVGGVEGSEGTPPITPTTPPPSAPSAPSGDESTGQPTPPEPAIPPALSPDEIERLVALRDELQSDAALRSLVADYYVNREVPDAGQPAPAQPAPDVSAAPPPAAPPLGWQPSPAPAPDPALDLEDPAIRALYERSVAQQNQLEQITGYVTAQAQMAQANQQAQAQSLVRRATESFRQAHSLEAADMEKLSTIAGRMQLVPALMSGVDPQTGLPTRPDPLAAVERALEIAYYATPEYRARSDAEVAARQKVNADRKQRLAAVGGSSGSVPRTAPAAPTTEQDRRAAMIRDMASMMDGSYTEQ